MTPRTVLLTGATSGIGLAAARALAREGAQLGLVARNPVRGQVVVDELRSAYPSSHAVLFTADLSSLKEVRRLAGEVRAQLPGINVLFNNAGAHLEHRETTVDGLERTFAVNHLAPFLLTELLLDLLKANAPSRVVGTASTAHRMAHLDLSDLQHEGRYGAMSAYSDSKLCNILFTYALARRCAGAGVTANCFHPGVVRSHLFRKGPMRMLWVLGTPFLVSPEKGAQTGVYLATSPEVEGVTGKYFVRCRPVPSRPSSYDEALQEQLWKASEELCRSSAA